jgi:hypothetical protein
MGLFQHPHLTRGIVKTAKGAFVVSRGLVDVPDELGESLGWRPADAADDTPMTVARSSLPARGVPDEPWTRRHGDTEARRTTQMEHEHQIVHGATHRSQADDTQHMTGADRLAARRRREGA